MNDTIRIQHLVDHLDATFLPELQEDYDNAGFLLGHADEPYRGALVALDLTPDVAREAIALGLNLIVTHHPLIFSGLRRITSQSELGRTVLALAEHRIAVYAAHTNLDNLPWGVNGALAERLGLQQCRILSPLGADTGAGLIGTLPHPVPADQFLQRVKEVLHIPTLRTSDLNIQNSELKIQNSKFIIQKVALCGGSGSHFIADAIAAGADLYLTADLKYHDFQRAEGRIILVDAGHYETEQFAKEIISRRISEKFSNFACRISSQQESIVRYI